MTSVTNAFGIKCASIALDAPQLRHDIVATIDTGDVTARPAVPISTAGTDVSRPGGELRFGRTFTVDAYRP
jgi:hypothetical protein